MSLLTHGEVPRVARPTLLFEKGPIAGGYSATSGFKWKYRYFFIKILALVTNIWQISQQALLVASVAWREDQGGRMNQSSPSHLTVFSNALKVDGTKSALTTDMASSENCRLNDKFGLLVQGILAAVAFSTLICKWRSIISVQCEILMDNFRPFL